MPPVFWWFSFYMEKKRIKKGKETEELNLPEWTGSVLLSQLPTIFAAMMLNFCVRHGYRCVHHAFATRSP